MRVTAPDSLVCPLLVVAVPEAASDGADLPAQDQLGSESYSSSLEHGGPLERGRPFRLYAETVSAHIDKHNVDPGRAPKRLADLLKEKAKVQRLWVNDIDNVHP